MSPFRAVGTLALIGAFLSAWLAYRNMLFARTGGRDLRDLVWLAVALAALGIGLILHSRWAALLFSCFSGYVGLLVAFHSVREAVYSPTAIPIAGLVANLTMAALLVSLCVLFYYGRWRLRKW